MLKLIIQMNNKLSKIPFFSLEIDTILVKFCKINLI